MLLRLLEWFLFSGVVGSVPLVADGLVRYWHGTFTWSGFIAEGNALVIGAVLAGAAIGRLVLWGDRYRMPQLITTCACVVAMAVSSWQYAAIRYTARGDLDARGAGAVSGLVLTLYLFSVLASSIAAVISEK